MRSDPYEERQFSWWWVVYGVAGVSLAVGLFLLCRWLVTPTGWLSLLGTISLVGSLGLLKASHAKAAQGIGFLAGAFFVSGFLSAYLNQETARMQQQLAPAAQQMIITDQKLLTPAAASPAPAADPHYPAPVYLVSPKLIEEGYQVPGTSSAQ